MIQLTYKKKAYSRKVASLADSLSYLISSVLYKISPQFYYDHLLYSSSVSRRFPFKNPTTLLLSYPRSGSSRIGNVLNSSPGVAYLHEPVTQSLIQRLGSSLADMNKEDAILKLTDEFMQMAITGTPPSKIRSIIRNKYDFSPLARWNRTLLINEINPNTIDFIGKTNVPNLILLLRHPAAVLQSASNSWNLDGTFEDFGRHYGNSMARVIRMATRKAGRLNIIAYEDVTASPKEQFSKLYDFLGVTRPGKFNQIMDAFYHNSEHKILDAGSERNLFHEPHRWRENLHKGNIQKVKKGYFDSELAKLGYYRGSKHWIQ